MSTILVTGGSGFIGSHCILQLLLHVASPLPPHVPKHEDELIVPARVRHAERAARDAGVKRVVMTSSFTAIGYGHQPQERPFDETSWTDPNGDDVLPLSKCNDSGARSQCVYCGSRVADGAELSYEIPH
jgi:nucleoside-diphosphate-sugar epimerase